MAGHGKRFSDAGYRIPKYLIEANNKTLLQYSIESLPIEIADSIIFIALEEHVDRYNLKSIISNILGNKAYQIIKLKSTTRGQAETVLMAKDYINPNTDLVIYNIDTYFESSSLKNLLLDKKEKYDGILGTFKSTENKWSFAKLDNNDLFVLQTTEKEPISDNALTGMYHFTSANDFLNVANYCIQNNVQFKNEFYIAPMYNILIEQGKKFVLDVVDNLIPLGTPEDVDNFKILSSK